MAKATVQGKSPSLAGDRSVTVAAVVVIIMICALWSVTNPWPGFTTLLSTPNTKFASKCVTSRDCAGDLRHDPPETTFYDDPNLSYTIEKPVKKWDDKRRQWLKRHPSFAAGAGERVLLLTGSQPSPCKNPIGDHLNLRFFKNKVDYCRLHGYDIFYNNVHLHQKMRSYWAKIPLVRAAMVAHPEAEWLWWVDSDAVFTDMDFKVPLKRYEDHNLVVHGWPKEVYEKKSWVAINAGIFLIRNCQWSMDFLEVWASMGPHTPNYKKWGQTLRSTLKDKLFPESDDQSGLVYLLLKEREKWGNKIYIENEYDLHGYWLGIVGKLDTFAERYVTMERKVHELRRRHAEVESESYGGLREQYIEEGGNNSSWRRPFITHFTGCQPCSGRHNPSYGGDSCWIGIERALNFADNQVLRKFGFVHSELENSSAVSPLPFDFPA
ncbi:unnamed protein product [Ilex paraguariensis]|uniref:Uncharacterized protein n=1 Tax=Ilex paraguariensis TaxID=185542 RepID=A0ABC8REL2_9AQUA